MYPQDEIRSPPAKDRSTVKVPSSPTSQSPASWGTFTDDGPPPSPGPSSVSPNVSASRLSREKNRLTLRAYLHSLLSSSTIASSPVLKSFLLASPTTLTPAELEDAKRREEADQVRDEGRKRFAKEIADRIDGLREAVKSVKGDVMGKGQLNCVPLYHLIHFEQTA